MHTPCSCGAHRSPFVLAQQVDPTRTKTLRDRFVADMTRRFRTVSRLTRESIVDNDCFGLKNQPVVLQEAAGYQQFALGSDQEKINAFMAWLLGVIQESIFNPEGWTNDYIDSAYKQGIRRARQEMRKEGVELPSYENQFVDEVSVIFGNPEHVEKVTIAYNKVISELDGVTSAMSQQISRALAEGLISGWNPEKIAREVIDRVDKVGITRARMIARTETIRAHHLATIQEYKNAELRDIKIQAEFNTAGDGRVCVICQGLNGRIFPIEQVWFIIPVHPNCRCICLPVVEQ